MTDSPSLKSKGSPTKKPSEITTNTLNNIYPIEEVSPGYKRGLSKSKLETINPFISPKSNELYDRPSSPAKTPRSSTPRSSKKKMSLGSPGLIRNSSTNSLSAFSNSPLRKDRRTLTARSTSTDKDVKPKSAFGRQFFNDNKNVSNQMKTQGSEYFEIKTSTKNLEKDLKSLENRVKKLQEEEKSSIKRLESTQSQCQKLIENKMRHQNDLIDNEVRKQQAMANLAKQRKEQMEVKMQLNENILRSMIDTMSFKNQQSQEVKQLLKEANENFERETTEKNKVRDKTIQDIRDLRKRIVDGRISKEEAAKEFALVTNYNNKLDDEKKRQDEINDRLEELTKQEEALLQKIRATNTLQESTFQKMEKVFSMRVSADKPLDLP